VTPGIVVLDGADSAGKTTLARHLVEEYGARYLHTGLSDDVWRLHMVTYRRAAQLAARGNLVVVDRHWMSECTYGQIYRGASAYPVAARCIDRLWLRAAAVHVICAPQDIDRHVADHAAMVKKRYEYVTEIRQLAQVYYAAAYGGTFGFAVEGDDYFARQTRLWPWTDWPHVLAYDRYQDGRDVPGYAVKLLDVLAGCWQRQHPLGLDPGTSNFAGHWATARWLIVGEAPTPRPEREDRAFPFVDRCTNDSAATWLNRALHALDYPEATLLWADAYAEPDDAQPARELETLAEDERAANLPAIALGGRAERALRNLGWSDVRPVPHPHYDRDSGQYAAFTTKLSEALR